MNIIIRAAGFIKSGPERTLIDDYLGRASVVGRNIGISNISESAVDIRSAKSRSAETETILSFTKPADILVVLDERGKALTSRQMARQIANWRDDGIGTLVFAIGGADGFEPAALPANAVKWQLGKPVWPHKLVRVMIAEQVYRALSILAGTPYHRD
ncbi:MAG: 23S rRNA (pseudouridine(1915)-N(3))-methyltransferase RlmH [Robiginitomaculum sp.]|nr:23S rRNA (pseudouridine(1915)-N(3))-methyltransferase RlmH [Robiginitomaculum sp.]